MLPPLSLYIHIPWCVQKCPYCDFNSHVTSSSLPEAQYIDVLLSDLAADIERFQITRTIKSIFIGGGTPSLFSAQSIAALLEGINQQLNLDESIEITLEANPNSVESEKFKAFKAAGVNRLSIGIQSFNHQHLKKLGRIHCPQEAINAAEIAHVAGFNNFNLDLMFGLPAQTLPQAIHDMEQAIALNPTHLSFYQLTLEPNTYFHKFPPKLPQDQQIIDIQHSCQHLLTQAGFKQYEVSAYAKQHFQCQHNLNYWKFGDYLGIGAGAHGKISQQLPDKVYRTSKIKQPQRYLQKTQAQSMLISTQEFPLEFMMNQLRLKAGFSLNHYQHMTGLSSQVLEPILSQAIAQKLLLKQGQHYSTTVNGWNFLDTLLEKFLV